MEAKVYHLGALLHSSEIKDLIFQLILYLFHEQSTPDFLIFQINIVMENLIVIIVSILVFKS